MKNKYFPTIVILAVLLEQAQHRSITIYVDNGLDVEGIDVEDGLFYCGLAVSGNHRVS